MTHLSCLRFDTFKINYRFLAIELCHVLHRTGLTQETAQPLLLAAEVLQLTITAAREDLERRKQEKIRGMYLN